jgi:hypothetical protein
MKFLPRSYFLLPLGLGIFILSACCVPAQKNSFPMVIDTSYNDSAVYDADQVQVTGLPPPNPLDSAFYPIYSLDIKNTGSEADTFKLYYFRVNGAYGFPLQAQAYVQPGETKTFRTYGPIPSNSLDTAKYRYLDFFVKTIDSISLFKLLPQVTIHYGETPNGPEQCGTSGKDISVDVTSLKHK